MPLGMLRGVDPRNHILDGRAHGRHLGNTVERLYARLCGSATSGGEVAYSQIALGNLDGSVEKVNNTAS